MPLFLEAASRHLVLLLVWPRVAAVVSVNREPEQVRLRPVRYFCFAVSSDSSILCTYHSKNRPQAPICTHGSGLSLAYMQQAGALQSSSTQYTRAARQLKLQSLPLSKTDPTMLPDSRTGSLDRRTKPAARKAFQSPPAGTAVLDTNLTDQKSGPR